jgi:hypothetical protein
MATDTNITWLELPPEGQTYVMVNPFPLSSEDLAGRLDPETSRGPNVRQVEGFE